MEPAGTRIGTHDRDAIAVLEKLLQSWQMAVPATERRIS